MSPASSSSSSSTTTTNGGLLVALIVVAAVAVAWLQTRIVPTAGVPPVVVTLVLAPAIAVVAFRIFRDGSKNDDDSSSTREAREASDVVEVLSPATPVVKNPKKEKKKKKRTKIKPSKHPRYVRRFAGHTGIIHDMSPSPNGEWMATSGADGQIRVTMVENKDPQHQVYLRANVENKDVATSLSWCPDNRTLACTFKNCADVAFYRMRKKHDAEEIKKQKPSAFPYELVELPKRRFSIASKMEDRYGDVTDCVVDSSHSNYTLILTACTDRTAAAWDGKTGDCVATVRTGSEGLRLSPNGSLLCGRPGDAHGGKSSNEVKIYEIHRTRRKGDAEPVFDKIPHKSVMTIVANVKVVDVAFGGARDGEKCDVAVVCGADGSVQVWNLDVEYRFAGGANPKLLCSTAVPPGEDGEVRKIVAVAAIASGGGDGSTTATTTRVAVATDDSALHLFTYRPAGDDNQRPSISSDFTIDDTHPEGVGDVRFCPSSSSSSGRIVLYTRSAAGREAFAWNVEQRVASPESVHHDAN